MKMALAVINGLFPNHHFIHSICNIAKSTSSTLHAFFLTHDTKSPEFDYLFPNDLSLTQNRLTGKTFDQENLELLNANIKIFTDACNNKGVKFIIQDTDVSLKELISYSEFADFIIADAKTHLGRYRLADLLADAHCPVFLPSKESIEIKSVIVTYDGDYSSIYAMKMFSYIFPEWNDLDTSVIYLASSIETIPSEEKITAWISQHFNRIKIQTIPGNIEKNLIDYINSNSENSLVVMGAYGRSTLSRLIHNSLADIVIEKTKASVFIMHE
jgi:nucleotide-binding universal stress UspA family protein